VTPPPSSDDALEHHRDDDLQTQEDDGKSRMSFLEHLDELRRRIIYAVYFLIAGTVIGFVVVDYVQDFLLRPLQAAIPNGGKLIATEVGELFMFKLKLAFLIGLLVALPGVLLQFWLFIAPGLYAKEKRYAIPFVMSASLLFFTGAWFSHVYAFPWTWKFFMGFTNDVVQNTPTVSNTFKFYVKMTLAFGAVFQMPVIVFVLARFGIVTAKFLWQKGKYAILIIFVIAAVASPGTDVVSQMMMAAPMILLYGLSIIVAWIFGKKKK